MHFTYFQDHSTIREFHPIIYRHAKANRDSHSTMIASISLCLPVLKHIPSPAKDNIIRKINDMFTYAVSNDLTF